MRRQWAGESERDRAVEAYAEARLRRESDGGRGSGLGRARAPGPQFDATLLLGPRGSGKTTLLRHLERWAQRAPVARLDLADLGQKGGKPIDALTGLVFRLNARKADFPRLTFPSFGLLVMAVAAQVDGIDRDTAVRDMADALAGPDSRRLEVLGRLADAVAGMVGAPGLAGAALPLLPEWQRGWGRLRTRLRLRRIRSTAPQQPYDTFLLELNRRYGAGEDDERKRAEAVLFAAFLDDLRRAYGTRSGDRRRTSRCLVLLDNVDSPLGSDFLELLLEARREADAADPLVVMAAAGSYPRVFEDHAWGGAPQPGAYPGRWDGEEFRPAQVARGLCVGQLRDLRRLEVERQAKEVLSAAGRDLRAPRADSGVKWLGWAVYELTRGQPAATAAVLEALLGRGDTMDWEERLRRVLDPSDALVDGLLDRLLPIDASRELIRALTRAAASVDLAHAGVAGQLWGEANAAAQKEFDDFCADVLCTMHIDTGDRAADGRTETLHPLLRLLLLRKLAAPAPASPGESGADGWEATHTALRARAEEADKPGLAAYHALALGDLPAAAAYLNERFGRIAAEDWCAELCRLRRAPLRPVGPDAPHRQPWERYEALVEFLNEGEVESRLRTVTRLLAASWIGPEPPPSPATDRVGDPYRDPLGDLYAELYGEIAARFRTLTTHTESVSWDRTLLAKAAQYEGKPW
ncbi:MULTISPECIES: ATP-binding protein [Streptomyces]|uniref:ATP-binding protein n=1 Tax=Streptomyces lonegramiae TaxID=3075524 RepID=A0ABU2XGS3_9ACTN|nr:ATP-binding protein [Streptomyces sp. DSM 41529]MDT0545137.1 ATP-binding protein [Streptomyces sp. DSM 41529]